jgi:hypothetical protein
MDPPLCWWMLEGLEGHHKLYLQPACMPLPSPNPFPSGSVKKREESVCACSCAERWMGGCSASGWASISRKPCDRLSAVWCNRPHVHVLFTDDNSKGCFISKTVFSSCSKWGKKIVWDVHGMSASECLVWIKWWMFSICTQCFMFCSILGWTHAFGKDCAVENKCEWGGVRPGQ